MWHLSSKNGVMKGTDKWEDKSNQINKTNN